METNAIQQEILLIKNTSYCRRKLFESENLENKHHLPHDEQLEVACWNGWLNDMLPGIVNTSNAGESLYVWEIMQTKVFLTIELCESPQMLDLQYSINPYAFLVTVSYE